MVEKRKKEVSSLPLNGFILSGIFAAVTAICSWINIPLPFTIVPINLALLGVHLSGSLLGCRYGLYAQLIYMLLGAIGVPVFAGFTGGFAVIAGPTGGFILGYILCAAVVGYIGERTTSAIHLVFAMLLGLFLCYGFGLIWFMIVNHASLWTGLISCVIPFLPGDAIKISAAVILTTRLRPIIKTTRTF